MGWTTEVYSYMYLNNMMFLFQNACATGVRVLIDAEQSYFQHAIEHLVLYYMMKRFNHTHPVIYNTVQAYLIVSVNIN